MAATRNEIIRWLKTLPKGAEVGIDEGGLALQEVNGEAYYEIGGIPEEDPEDEMTATDSA